jgi:MFS family permease
MGLVMGFLAVKFKHKSLFLLGVAFYGVGALGWFFAPNLAFALFFNVFLGIGGTMIAVMVWALIGDFLPLQKKGMAAGLAVGGIFIANIIMPQVTSVITNAAGWRSVLLWFIFPLSIVSLLLGFFILPSKPRKEQIASKPQYLEAFKQILTNKSAVACVISTLLVWISNLHSTYAVSFFILHFKEPLSTAAIFATVVAAMALVGGIVGGRLVNRVGRKPLTVVAGIISAIFIILIVFVPNVWASAAMWMVAGAFVGASAAGGSSLALEQVPSFRGTMMSLNSSFQNIGLIMGLAVSGWVLNLYANNFKIIFTMFGVAGVASAAVIFLFAKDPTKNQKPPTP